ARGREPCPAAAAGCVQKNDGPTQAAHDGSPLLDLARVWAGWRQPLVIVTADTVLRWQRRRFREYWSKLSGRSTGGRPAVHAEIKTLITRMATANPLGRPTNPWRAPEARYRRGRAHRLPADAEAASPAVADVADVPRQPCPRFGRPRLLHGSHRALARPLRARRARSPSPARRPLQRDRPPHGPLDR